MKVFILSVFLPVSTILFGMETNEMSGSPIFKGFMSTLEYPFTKFQQVQRYNSKKYAEGQASVLGIDTSGTVLSEVKSEQNKNREIYEKVGRVVAKPESIENMDENDWNAYAERSKLVNLYLKALIVDKALNDQERLRRINMLLCYHYPAFINSLSLLVSEGIKSQNSLEKDIEVLPQNGKTLLSNIQDTLLALQVQLGQLEVGRPMKRMVPADSSVVAYITNTTTPVANVPNNQQSIPASTQESANQQVPQGKIKSDDYLDINKLTGKIYPQND